MTSPGHGAVRGSQDSTPTPETLLTENISPSRAELLPTWLPSVFTLSQTRTPASFQNASNIKEIYLQKKKKSIPQFPKMPLSGFTWLNLGNVIGTFILPKPLRTQALKTTCVLHPQRGHKSMWHKVYPWVVD